MREEQVKQFVEDFTNNNTDIIETVTVIQYLINNNYEDVIAEFGFSGVVQAFINMKLCRGQGFSTVSEANDRARRYTFETRFDIN